MAAQQLSTSAPSGRRPSPAAVFLLVALILSNAALVAAQSTPPNAYQAQGATGGTDAMDADGMSDGTEAYDPNGGNGANGANGAADAPNDAPNDAPAGSAYGYLRRVEGSATLTQAYASRLGSAPPNPGLAAEAGVPAQVNQPISVGDALTVPARGHVEIVLPDHNILRLDGETQVVFSHLANSADPAGRQDTSTELRLDEGNLQLVVTGDSVGQQMPTVLTPNASIYIQALGSYRITTDSGTFSEIVARRGAAQVVAERGDRTVHAGEEAIVDNRTAGGGRRPGLDPSATALAVRQAGAYDSLEGWGRQLDAEPRVAASTYVDPSLAYEAAPLDRYGHWTQVDDRRYWQPNDVDSGWTPYYDGSWSSTASGLTWVSNEPWGWVPYHYGSWEYLPDHGWGWRPGAVYSPAWVYWYWGPSHVGWCPIGYYSGYYGNAFSAGFRFGLYGWAGGSWGSFAHWNFVPFDHFWGRDWNRWAVGRGWGGVGGRGGWGAFPGGVLARGLITTTTRGLAAALRGGPGHLGLGLNAAGAMRFLGGRDGGFGRAGGRLPDVTPFIGRQAHLPAQVAHAVGARGRDGGFGRDGGRMADAGYAHPAPARPQTASPYRGTAAGRTMQGQSSVTRPAFSGRPAPASPQAFSAHSYNGGNARGANAFQGNGRGVSTFQGRSGAAGSASGQNYSSSPTWRSAPRQGSAPFGQRFQSAPRRDSTSRPSFSSGRGANPSSGGSHTTGSHSTGSRASGSRASGGGHPSGGGHSGGGHPSAGGHSGGGDHHHHGG
jgi:hypothetical protein